MAKYIAKRVLISIVTLWVLVTVVFVLVRCMPGDPFQGDKMTPEIRANMEAYYGFDKSLPEQYIQYIQNLLHGDFGYSMKYTNQSVNKIITQTFPYSFDLGIRAFGIWQFIWTWYLVILARSQREELDYVCVVIAILGTSIPDFIMGVYFAVCSLESKWGLAPGSTISWISVYYTAVHRNRILYTGNGFQAYEGKHAGGCTAGLYQDGKIKRNFKNEDYI